VLLTEDFEDWVCVCVILAVVIGFNPIRPPSRKMLKTGCCLWKMQKTAHHHQHLHLDNKKKQKRRLTTGDEAYGF
jgi:hypothetical protein